MKRTSVLICTALVCLFFSNRYTEAYSPVVSPIVKGSAAKPYEKKKVAVFGGGGYLGANIFGFLQRAGSLYGTGIAGIGAPRLITATATGSASLNGVLSKNFILAQADESFVKLTDMTCLDSIRSRVRGFDVVVLATRYTLEQRPVTGGSYEKTPNDKTMEFYMDKARSPTKTGSDDPAYCTQMFTDTLKACEAENVKRIVVIETDSQFDSSAILDGPGYIETLEKSGLSYVYVQPVGTLENFSDFTYAKGVQGELNVQNIVDPSSLKRDSIGKSTLYREDLAAFCAQCIMSLDWRENKVVRLSCTGIAASKDDGKKPNQQWCANSDVLASLLTNVM